MNLLYLEVVVREKLCHDYRDSRQCNSYQKTEKKERKKTRRLTNHVCCRTCIFESVRLEKKVAKMCDRSGESRNIPFFMLNVIFNNKTPSKTGSFFTEMIFLFPFGRLPINQTHAMKRPQYNLFDLNGFQNAIVFHCY